MNRKLSEEDIPQGSYGLEVTSQLTIDESPAEFSARIVRTDGAEIPAGLVQFTVENNDTLETCARRILELLEVQRANL